MRYIKLFESHSALEDIRDICLELGDIGMLVTINPVKYTRYNIIIEYKYNIGDRYFKYSDVSEVVERLKRYWGISIKSIQVYQGNWSWVDIDHFKSGNEEVDSDFLNSLKIHSLKIQFVL